MTVKCECTDPSCPVCGGKCPRRATAVLVRIDTDDRDGTAFCAACADDALAAGVFRRDVAAKIRRGV